jgi:lactate permease
MNASQSLSLLHVCRCLIAWAPYLLVALLLVLTRLAALPFQGWLQGVHIEVNNILGTPISTSFAPLYLPGTIFLVVVLVTVRSCTA